LTLILTISACSTNDIGPESRIEIREVPIDRPAPIVPVVDQVQARDVKWIVITQENYQEVFAQIQSTGSEPVLIGLTTSEYENLSLNISDLRALIQQQNIVIGIYQQSYNR